MNGYRSLLKAGTIARSATKYARRRISLSRRRYLVARTIQNASYAISSLVNRPSSTRALHTSSVKLDKADNKNSHNESMVIGPEYEDSYITSVLSDVKKYLQDKGYRVIPVNPGAAGKEILKETCYASIADIPNDITIDMVDAFQRAERCPAIAMEAVQRGGVQVLWLQLGIVSEEAEKIACDAGLRVVMNRCPKIEFSRLYGELSMHGFNSDVISSKRRPVGTANEERKGNFSGATVGFETKAIHAGASPDPTTGARSTPIFQTTAYVFEDVDNAASLFNLSTFGNIYSRLSNPTTAVLEERLASLDSGRGATCTASGHSAQLLAVFALMQPGDTIVSSNKLYGGTITQFGKTIAKFGWDCTFVDTDDLDAVREAVNAPNSNVKCLWAESLANPGGSISDIAGLSSIAKEAGIPLIIDNTMATPYLCKPIDHGADLVVYSTTKFLSGHGNAMGGAVVDSGKFDWAQNDKFPSLSQPEPAYHGLTFQETFGDLAFTTFSHAVSLRNRNSVAAYGTPLSKRTKGNFLSINDQRIHPHVAEYLASRDDEVEWVSYAGLTGSKYEPLVKRYMPNGAGSVFTFGLKGGFQKGVKVVEACEIFSHLANIGDTRSLILHPASTTHRQLTPEQRETAGAGDNVIRLSIGLETAEDLIKDLEHALAA
eukprot:jgi/Bigna1/80093/fgenesh1_pg.67_\